MAPELCCCCGVVTLVPSLSSLAGRSVGCNKKLNAAFEMKKQLLFACKLFFFYHHHQQQKRELLFILNHLLARTKKPLKTTKRATFNWKRECGQNWFLRQTWTKLTRPIDPPVRRRPPRRCREVKRWKLINIYIYLVCSIGMTTRR